jgi:SAM-dependent methyltransferase
VLAVGRDPAIDPGQHRFVAQDLNHAGFASPRGIASFDLVVAVEGIEHAKKPVRFLRNIPPLLAPGVAVIAAPSDRVHLCAIFWDPCGRASRPPAGLKPNQRFLFAPNGDPLTDKPLARPLALAAAVFSPDSVLGHKPILVFKAAR